MLAINAQDANGVKAYCVNAPSQNRRMGKKSILPASPFWQNLVKAWGRQGLPTSQNGVAKKLRRDGKPMSQGSAGRWYRGDGYPEIPQLIQIAQLGKCSIDWLLTNEGPESRPNDPQTSELLRYWGNLGQDGRTAVLRAAKMEAHATTIVDETAVHGLLKPVKRQNGGPQGKTKQ
jgi:hypothetical protein